MIRRLVLIVNLLLAFPAVAWANPSGLAGPYGFIFGLFVEAVLIAFIIGRHGFDPLRLFYCWLALTSATFMLLVGFLRLFERIQSDLSRSSGFVITALFAGEIVVVMLEAAALSWMTRMKFFRNNAIKSLPFLHALPYSILVNFISFLM